MEFTKQDWALVNDLINIAWGAGAVKSPNMGAALEQLRGKVTAKINPAPTKPEVIDKKGGK